MSKLHNYFFPESFYPPVNSDYADQVSKGLKIASGLNVLFVSVARDVGDILNRNLLVLSHMRRFFKKSSVFLYENDSKDSTKKILEKYKKYHYSVVFTSEKLGTDKLADQSLTRRTNMACARNKYLEYGRNKLKNIPDKIIILDLDLLGGYSYTGLLTSLNCDDNSCIGSNSIIYQDKTRLYYDTWAYKDSNNQSEADKNLLIFHRGESLVPVQSCFGGMIIYPGSILEHDIWYTNEDCDHVTLNNQLTQLGYNIFLNPSQITLYSSHYYV